MLLGVNKLKENKMSKAGRQPKPVLERLLNRTYIPIHQDGTNDHDKCWLWRGPTNNHGYGMMKVSAELNMATVHRISYIEHTKKLNYGEKKMVIHKCGNKLCVNPDHLVTGNLRDKTRIMHDNDAWRNHPFNNKEFMWRTCEHCGKQDYLPHFKRLHSQCKPKTKHKYSLQSNKNREKK